MDSPGYRRGVGIVLVNAEGRIWIGRRPKGGWHMPQGGIDPGEEPRQTVMRELREEVGTTKATILAVSDEWLAYEVPEKWRPASWENRYVGQTQKWFLLGFDGDDGDIDLETHDPEFAEWRWATRDEVLAEAIEFKRELYPRVFAALL